MSLDLATEIFIEAEVPREITAPGLADLLAYALTAEKASGNWRIELVLADDALLRQLHRDFMGLDSATDIMTFPDHDSDHDSDHGGVNGGQMYISVERATEQAAEFRQTTADEIRFLVLHGTLHLCGWNDDTDAKRTAMLDRQAHLLRDYDRTRP